LKTLVESDLELILSWRNSAAVRKSMYSDHRISMTEHRTWFKALEKDASRHWYLFVDEKNTPNGVVYFTDIDTSKNTAFLGFYARPGARAGTGSRIGLEALDTAFGTLQLHKLSGKVLATNSASINLFRRLGFSEDGQHRDQHFKNSVRVNVLRFRMIRDEWQSARRRLVLRIGLFEEKSAL